MHVYPDHQVVAAPGSIDFPGLTKCDGYTQQDGWHFVRHTLPNAALFAHAGHPMPHPMRYRYNWNPPWENLITEVLAIQQTTSCFFTLNPRGYCFNDIGTGKTASALWAIDFLWQERQLTGPVVICCPVSTMRLVWLSGIVELFGPLRYKIEVLHGIKDRRLKALARDADFYIINHDGLKVIGRELEARKDIQLIVVDEGTAFQNDDTDAWHYMNKQAGPLSGRGVWWLTGSPTPNSPLNAWGQGKIVAPWHLPRYYSTFKNDVTLALDGLNGRVLHPKKGWQKYVAACLKPAVRFPRVGVPEPVIEYREVPLSKEQSSAYNQLRDLYSTQHADGDINVLTEPAKRTKLLQVSCGSVINDDGGITVLDFRPKLKVLREVIREAGGTKVIVFVPYKAPLAAIVRSLETTYRTVSVSGSVPPGKQRDAIFHSFQHGDADILVAHPECMAHGLTLTASHTVVWWSAYDNAEIVEQANGRVTRPGQKNQPVIVYLRSSELERKVYSRLRSKQSMQGVLLEILEAA